MLVDSLLKPGAALLNRGIGQSSSAAELARSLESRSIRIHLTGPDIALRISVAAGLIDARQDLDEPVDASISGSPLALARLLGSDTRRAIREAGIDVAGDMEIAEQFSQLFRLAGPDLEDELAGLIGDAPAWQIGQAARHIRRWTSTATESVGRSLREFLQEESGRLPTRFEAEEFMSQVDELANDVERAEARLQRAMRQNQRKQSE